MPRAWSDKDERQYEHVKESELDEGRSTERAKEIAARTVNKQRSSEGRTKEQQEGKGSSSSSSGGSSGGGSSGGGSGGGSSRSGSGDLESRTRRELYNRAKELDIEGRSGMSKSQLIRAIRQRT